MADWKGPEAGQVGMSRKVRWKSAQWSPVHKPCFILPPKGRRAPRQMHHLFLQRSPSASSRAGLGHGRQGIHTLSGRPLWVNVSGLLAPSSSESHCGCRGRSIGWIQTWSEKALRHRGALASTSMCPGHAGCWTDTTYGYAGLSARPSTPAPASRLF